MGKASTEDRTTPVEQLSELLERIAERVDLPTSAVVQALDRVVSLSITQGFHESAARDDLVQALLVDFELLDRLPKASVEQARRVAETRNRLLASGAWSVADLADVHGFGENTSSARGWIKRHRDAHRIVTVTAKGETRVPALLLDDVADPWPGADRVIGPLVQAGMDSWAVWRWLDTPSGWLDGDRPADLLSTGAIDEAARAATSQAANAAPRAAGRNAAA